MFLEYLPFLLFTGFMLTGIVVSYRNLKRYLGSLGFSEAGSIIIDMTLFALFIAYIYTVIR